MSFFDKTSYLREEKHVTATEIQHNLHAHQVHSEKKIQYLHTCLSQDVFATKFWTVSVRLTEKFYDN